MNTAYYIHKDNRNIEGEIKLAGSKSISNRVLIIQSLCKDDFEIKNLSTSDDTIALQKGLSQNHDNQDKTVTIDVGHAGTTMRFLTALMATKDGYKTILTGSERMQQRPIGVLVDALRELGADIEYVKNEGYPPMQITGKKLDGGQIKISAGVSSQYLSALLMIAPSLENGLEMELVGDLVSRPYLEMTLKIMEVFGVKHQWEGQNISVAAQKYQATDFVVEADWSSASYLYAMVAFSENAKLTIDGLHKVSTQGDSVLHKMMERFGVQTKFGDNCIYLSKEKDSISDDVSIDFIECPDLAQTIAVVCAGNKVNAEFSGLQTLAIKETDRTAALQTELAKINCQFVESDTSTHSKLANAKWVLDAQKTDFTKKISVATYHDHRMAMAFAPLAMILDNGVTIEDPEVVTKSYIRYWEDLEKLGFNISNATKEHKKQEDV